ncbi:MAG: carboxypeptidase-like regulatory domain-containing protein [Candidatus Aminicenantes bacterium]|nr:carboxypeptidase-like regulatory domain-containing protein [Candidatus Aminicenantes bacterium]
MSKKLVALFAILAILVLIPLFAAQSRTTEYHKAGQKIANDTTFNITLPDGYFLTGTVKGLTGAVVKAASVYVGDATDRFSGFAGVTDTAGKFSVPVQPGTKYLVVGPPASASVDPSKFSRLLNKTVEGINVTKDTAYGDVALQNGYILSGKVDPPAGTATPFLFIPSIQIFLTNSLTMVDVAQTGGTSQAILNKYAVALPAGTYRIMSRATALTQAFQAVPMLPKLDQVNISKDTVKNIAMAKGGYSFSGTLKDASGKGLDGILYVVPKTGVFKGWPIQAMIAIKGVFGLMPGMNIPDTFIPAGTYVLVFIPFGYTTTGYAGKATVTYFDLTMPAVAKTQALVAKNGFVVSGKVVDAKGKAAKATITAFSSGAPLNVDLLGLNFAFAQTDSKGQYRFALPAGTFNIMATPITSGAAAAWRPEEKMRRMMLRAVSNGSAPF